MASFLRFLAVFGLLARLGSAVRIAKRRSQRRPLCDRNLIARACLQFSSGNDVTAEVLADSLVISKVSAAAFLQDLGFDGDAPCQELCEKTVARFPEDELPPSSKVGCRMVGVQKLCDIDLSEEALAELAKQGANRTQRQGPGIQKTMSQSERKAMAVRLATAQDASFADVQMQVANWFQVWPLKRREIGMAASGGSNNQDYLDQLTKAYLSTVLQKLWAREIDNLVQKWFGGQDWPTRKLVADAMKHIQNVMKAPHYINHPNMQGYYGWVEWPYEQARNGTWPIHLAGAYFNSGTPDRIGTLTHEATHFYPLGTWDHIYCDIPGCLRMARNEKEMAQENADHFAFFIDEVVGGGMR